MNSNNKRKYILDMFPYPSGEGLHVGHPKGYIATDIYSRFYRMKGYEVIHPMGWDAFGLPAEQFALKNKVHPAISTAKNIENFKKQLELINIAYDWNREISTCDPKFYKWTQWIFKQLYKKGLAYESYEPINWCPSCKTGLANEDLDVNACERCGTIVEKKPLRQWTLRITDYADRLINDLDELEWPEWVKVAQRNWIGRSEGSEIDFKTSTSDSFKIFTTRADTLYGCTYTVLAPEHTLVSKWLDEGKINNKEEVLNYIAQVKTKSDLERSAEGREKTGVKLEGVMAINPINGEELPIYIADYVLSSYGTGAIMAVPAHDERDYEFAKKYNISIKPVIATEVGEKLIHDKEVSGSTVIAYDKNKNLWLELINLNNNEIWLPSGGKEDNETYLDCAKRELSEEAGIELIQDIVELGSPILTYYFNPNKNSNRKSYGHNYLAFVDSEQQIKLKNESHEKYEVKWVSYDDLVKDMKAGITDCEHWLLALHRAKSYLESGKLLTTDDGVLINSGDFNGMSSQAARIEITKKLNGKIVTKYKLRDWVFARQRYWGEPFPIVYSSNEQGNAIYSEAYTVADSELPVLLPEVESYEPTGTGESPLAGIASFTDVYGYINDEGEFVSCDKGDARAKLFKRETNTMPQWAGSSWYWLRFLDPHNDQALINSNIEKAWPQVDVYVGGDHATRHLIYARFWHKFLYDIGAVSNIEPFKRLEFLGFILAEDGRKMSKRWGNIINPDDIVREYGSDTLRVYEMFMAPFEATAVWSTSGIKGAKRFIDRVSKLHNKIQNTCTNEALLHKTIKKVGEDIESFKFNTAVSSLMILLNYYEENGLCQNEYDLFMTLLAPFAPTLCKDYLTKSWPQFNTDKIKDSIVELAVSFNGKFKGTMTVPADLVKTEAEELVRRQDIYIRNSKATDGSNMTPKNVIYVQNKIINFIF